MTPKRRRGGRPGPDGPAAAGEAGARSGRAHASGLRGDGPRAAELALPALSGLLLALSFPPLGPVLLPFVALVPLAVFVAAPGAGAGGRRGGWRGAFRGGAVTGVVSFGLLLTWVPGALSARPWVGLPAYVALVAVLALVPAGAAAVLHRGVHDLALPPWVVLPAAWTAGEWVRAHLPAGLAFPWLGLGASLADHPTWLVLAEWTGERGATLWIALVNGLVAEAVLRARGPAGRGVPRRRAALLLVAASAALVLPPVAGRARSERLRIEPALRVAVVGTAVPPERRRDPGRAADEMAATVSSLLASLEPGSAELVVLPETAFPVPLETAEGTAHLAALRDASRRLDAPILAGALGVGDRGSPAPDVYNSVFLVDGSGIRARYDKRRLVPGVERAPLLPSPFLAAVGDSAAYARGVPAPLPRVGGVGLGPLVCYESAFGGLARSHRRRDADVLVNVTNDAWFGDLPVAGKAARAQHAAHLVLRAVETRAGVVRSANLGPSLFVDPVGRVTTAVPSGETGVRVLDVTTTEGPTIFVRLGDVVGPACAVAALLLSLVASLPGRRGGRASEARGDVEVAES